MTSHIWSGGKIFCRFGNCLTPSEKISISATAVINLVSGGRDSNIFSIRYKIDYDTKSSRSKSIFLGEFTGHCKSVPSSSLANCRDNYMCCVSGKSGKRSKEENILKELSKTSVAFQILMTLLYCISNINDFEAPVEFESQSDSINKLASLDFYTPRTQLQTEKAATAYTTIAEFTEWYGRTAEPTEW